MKRSLLAITLAVSVMLIVFAGTASAGRGLTRRYSADAFFTDTTGCVSTFIGIYPVSGKDRNTGRVTGGTFSVQWEQFDVCTNTFLFRGGSAILTLSSEEFTMSPGLNKASMHTSAAVCDQISGSCFTVSIDLEYERAGAAPQVCSTDIYADEETTFCSAVVTGAVSDGTTNFTPQPGEAVFQEHRPA